MAPQLMGTKGFSARVLLRCRARTRSSLPVPDSPVTRTVLSEGATLARIRNTSCKAELFPIIPQVSNDMASPGKGMGFNSVPTLPNCQDYDRKATPKMHHLLKFPPHSRSAVFVAREKRFLVHVLVDGEPVVAHTNNSGSMLGLLRPGMEVFLSPAASPKRKLPYTLELVRPCGDWVGVNTSVPNRLLKRMWETGAIPEFSGYTHFAARGRARGFAP
jgi:hypothetical protein